MKSVRESGKQAIRDIKHKSKSIKSKGNHKQQVKIFIKLWMSENG